MRRTIALGRWAGCRAASPRLTRLVAYDAAVWRLDLNSNRAGYNALVANRHTNRVAWGLAMGLAVGLLLAGVVLALRIRPYWVAKYRGREANLHGAFLF